MLVTLFSGIIEYVELWVVFLSNLYYEIQINIARHDEIRLIIADGYVNVNLPGDRQFYTTCLNIIFVGIRLGWTF